MLVKDLIDYLKKFDPEFEVLIEKDFGCFTITFDEVIIRDANSRNNTN